ncbi:hypothetical protein AC578_1285 [Pseudocercospora eumusae]|uniref:Uncharacterized protein n=1 Tax=Pseudocercospora eumusae TaxID=321146 RepID=A0A139HU93_9PEZI|nr:hypothetical protein AC578_1285 [Pseudocercospora eumusae]
MEADRATGFGSQQKPAQQAQQALVNLIDTESEREKAIEDTTGVADLMAGLKLVDMTEAAEVNSTEAVDEDVLDANTKRRLVHFLSGNERPAPKSSVKGKSKAEIAPVVCAQAPKFKRLRAVAGTRTRKPLQPITAMQKESLASVQDVISKRCRFDISLAEDGSIFILLPRQGQALDVAATYPTAICLFHCNQRPTKKSSKVPQIFGAGGNSKKTDTAHFLPLAPGLAPALDDALMQFPNSNKDKDNDTNMSNAAKKATVENVAEEALLVEGDINRIMNLNYLSDKVKLQVAHWRKRDRVNKAFGMPVQVWSNARPDLGVSINRNKCLGD